MTALVVIGILAAFVADLAKVFAHPKHGFVFTRPQAALWAALALAAILVLMDLLVTAAQTLSVPARLKGLKGLIVGTDLRVSTSKLQAALWTCAVLYALTFFLLLGRMFVSPFDCGGAKQPTCAPPDVSAFKDIFEKIANQPLKAEYIALLGIPLAGAVAAKAITTGKVVRGDLLKQPSNSSGVAAGAAEVVTNDAGTLDLLDFQYAAFNIVALIYFFIRLLGHAADGLPTIPSTLLVLSGVSVSAYAAKKALETGVGPIVTSAEPRRVLLTVDSLIRIYGAGFVPSGASPSPQNAIYLDGRQVSASNWTPTSVEATLPLDKPVLKSAGFRAVSGAELVVYDDAGQSGALDGGIDIVVPSDWDT